MPGAPRIIRIVMRFTDPPPSSSAQDVCWSLYIGRDCAMAPPKEGQGVPVPFVDSEFDHEPWAWEPSGLPPQKSNIASVFAATCELLRIGRRVMDFVYVRCSGQCLGHTHASIVPATGLVRISSTRICKL